MGPLMRDVDVVDVQEEPDPPCVLTADDGVTAQHLARVALQSAADPVGEETHRRQGGHGQHPGDERQLDDQRHVVVISVNEPLEGAHAV